MDPNKAVAVFQGFIQGTVYFTEQDDKVLITINLKGLPQGSYGFHVHECGDLTDGCTSMCSHFNPYSMTHGGPESPIRHVGDLGNVYFDNSGRANYSVMDSVIKLSGKCNIIGRGLIIHEEKDDLGLGGNAESLKTGNAGKRIACAIIGYAKKSI
jgi:Cu-Zn family superoxide dismutase